MSSCCMGCGWPKACNRMEAATAMPHGWHPPNSNTPGFLACAACTVHAL
jgi:hypothetical protein